VNAVPYVPPVSPGSVDYLVSSTEEDHRVSRSHKPNTENSARYIYQYPLQVLDEQILVKTPLVGRHQLRNVALAIAAAEELGHQGFGGISAKSIEAGVRQTHWPGRFQMIPARAGWPEMVIDVAHNPAGAWALRSALSERYEDRPLLFVFGAMRDKAIPEMTEILFPLAERVIATRPENPRAASAEEIRQAGVRTGVAIEAVEDVSQALERARELANEKTVVVVSGSMYLVGQVMGLIEIEVER
jgi:dihydrofolate synthase/folylpolyglutamate synthase